MENKAFKGFFVDINLRKKCGLFPALKIQTIIKFCLTYMLLAKL